VADAIEDHDATKLDERAALLAYHWDQAGVALEATKWHRRAAEWMGANNPAEALRHWSRVRELLDTLPETPENLAARAEVRAQILLSFTPLGDPADQATSVFQEGRELATRIGDPRVLSLILQAFALLQFTAGAIPQAQGPLLELLQRADETKDIRHQVTVRYGLCATYFYEGRLRECLVMADQGLGLARGNLDVGADLVGRFSPGLILSCLRGIALVLTGSLHEGSAELDRVIELARTTQPFQHQSVWVHVFQVFRCEITGDKASALAHAHEAVDGAEKVGGEVARLFAYLSLGLANLLNRTWRDALEALEQALSIGRERKVRLAEARVLAAMATAQLGLGDGAAAGELAEEAIVVARQLGTRFWEFAALLSRVDALRETRGVEAAGEMQAALVEAAAWIEWSGAKGYEPLLQLEHAELARLTGDEASREHSLRQAHRLFVEIGATARAQQVAREIGWA
jgi:adenylate cyclase